jgi:hypothetical protein
MSKVEQLRIVDAKITAAIRFARDELDLSYLELIGLMQIHVHLIGNEICREIAEAEAEEAEAEEGDEEEES